MSSQYLPLYKIIILYMLNRAESALTRSQLMDFMLVGEYTNFTTLSEVFGELEDAGLIRIETDFISADENSGRSYFYLTPEGKETLKVMKDRLRADIMEQADAYLKANNSLAEPEAFLRTDYKMMSDGTYEILLEIFKDGKKTLGINVYASSEEKARELCECWKNKAEEAERYLEKLLGD